MTANLGKKLYIIEDDANILYGLRAKFSLDGFQTEVDIGIEDVENILNKIRIFNPDYIILDLILPKVNGFDLLAKIKADQRIFKIPVFIFTNLSDEDSKARGKKLGTDYYFIKNDFTLDEFVDKVKNIIKNRW